MGHIASQCKQSTTPLTKRACYVCDAAGHLARLLRAEASAASETDEKLATTRNLVQTAVLRKPYLVTVKIKSSENTDKTDTYIIDAIIDSSSSISLIRSSIIENEVCSPVDAETNQFCGINGVRLEILNVFYSDIEIKGVRTTVKFYTVLDNAMAYKVLLSRDFIACPSLRITLGDTVEIENIAEENAK